MKWHQYFLECKWKSHDDVIKWKHFPRYWPFVRGIHRSPVNSPHKGQWRGALMFSLICARINGWVNNREAGDLRRNRAHYGVIVMVKRKHGDLLKLSTVCLKNGQVFSLILDSSVSLSAGIHTAEDSVPETLGSNPAFSRGRQLVYFRFENRLPESKHRN